MEIAHDHVRATLLDHGDGAETAWTEVETELIDGDTALLDAVEKRLRAAGLRRSKSPSKLARALGKRLADAPGPPQPPSSTDTAGDVALAYVHEQVAAIIGWDPEVRRDEPDSVHQMRVSTRRLRSAFKSFRRELDREATDPVGDELKWLAGVLGLERDREVLADRLRDREAELPEELVTEVLTARIGGDAPVHEGARKELLRELGGRRYFRLLDTLESLLADPPLLDAAAAPRPTPSPRPCAATTGGCAPVSSRPWRWDPATSATSSSTTPARPPSGPATAVRRPRPSRRCASPPRSTPSA